MPKRFMTGGRACAPIQAESYQARLAQFLEMSGQQVAQAAETRVSLQVCTCVIERPRDVLDVDRVRARGRLETEGPQCLQVPLQRHQVETASEITPVGAAAGTDAPKSEEE